MALRIIKDKFYSGFKSAFYPEGGLQSETITGLDFILDHIEKDGLEFWGRVPAIAYALATFKHESRKIVNRGGRNVSVEFNPVRETLAKEGTHLRTNQDRYIPFYGRGIIQTTWEENYRKIGDYPGIKGLVISHPADGQHDITVTGEALVANPDLMLDPELSFRAAAYGMRDGLYRKGHTLARYFEQPAKPDYLNARNIVNGGHDKAEEIAADARKFELILKGAIPGYRDYTADARIQAPAPSEVAQEDAAAGAQGVRDHIDKTLSGIEARPEDTATGETIKTPPPTPIATPQTEVKPTKLSGKVVAAIGFVLTQLTALWGKLENLPPAVLAALIIGVSLIAVALIIGVIYIKDRREHRAHEKDVALINAGKA